MVADEAAKPPAEEPAGAPQADEAAQPPAEERAGAPQAEAAAEAPAAEVAEKAVAKEQEAAEGQEAGRHARERERAPRSKPKPEVPGEHLEVDIVPEGVDPLGRGEPEDPYALDPYAAELEEEEALEEPEAEEAEEEAEEPEPIVTAAIDLAAGARYRATGKRKTSVARVIVKPGKGEYTINGRPLSDYFPRATLQRNICQPLEAVGYGDRMDVIARLHGGGVASQAGALRHGIAKALLEADPNLRGELKRRGLLTRDARVKERKKAGLKKARKRPQFSKR
jgi:small subunit ribosomal protein S9